MEQVLRRGTLGAGFPEYGAGLELNRSVPSVYDSGTGQECRVQDIVIEGFGCRLWGARLRVYPSAGVNV